MRRSMGTLTQPLACLCWLGCRVVEASKLAFLTRSALVEKRKDEEKEEKVAEEKELGWSVRDPGP